jgi:hypothetical protein
MFPIKASVAPVSTCVPPAVEPRALSLAAVSAPAWTSVRPSYVLSPESSRLPPPALTIPAPLPAMFAEIVRSGSAAPPPIVTNAPPTVTEPPSTSSDPIVSS